MNEVGNIMNGRNITVNKGRNFVNRRGNTVNGEGITVNGGGIQ